MKVIYRTKHGRTKILLPGISNQTDFACQQYLIFLHFQVKCNYFTNILPKNKALILMLLMDFTSVRIQGTVNGAARVNGHVCNRRQLHLKFSDDSCHWFILGWITCSYHRFLEFISWTGCHRTAGKLLLSLSRVHEPGCHGPQIFSKQNIQKKTDGAEGDTKEENVGEPQPDVIPEKARRRVRKDD